MRERSLVMRDEAPVSMTQPPYLRVKLFIAAIRVELSQAGDVEDDDMDRYTGADVMM
jgi:hypothetical protein